MEIQIIYNEIDKYRNLKSLFKKLTRWLTSQLNLPVKTLDVIFTNDQYLQNLHHDFFDLDSKTDVITFDLNEEEDDIIEGEIYISVERAEYHSQKYDVSTQLELCRLIIHGCLHLAGYEDSNKENRTILKKKEEQLVNAVNHLFIKNIAKFKVPG